MAETGLHDRSRAQRKRWSQKRLRGLGMKQFSATWFFPLWLASLACAVGLLIFADLPWLSTIFFPLGYIALLCALLATVCFWHDWLNPLSLIVLIGFVRFSIPGIATWFTEPDIPIFHIMGLQSEHWRHGHILALIGLLSATIGWCIVERTDNSRFFQIFIPSKPELLGGVLYSAMLGMLLGFIALIAFVNFNVSIIEATITGIFRSTQIQEGSGKYFYLSFMLISSSVVLTDYFFSRKLWLVDSLTTRYSSNDAILRARRQDEKSYINSRWAASISSL